MLRQIVAVGAVLLAAVVSGSNLSPGHPGSVGASQASPAAEADCPATTPEENEALVQPLLRRGLQRAQHRGHRRAARR